MQDAPLGGTPTSIDWTISQALTADLPEIARLVNSAYRGDAARQGWTHEADLLDGQRTDPVSLAEELAGANPAALLCLRDAASGPIFACVFLERLSLPDGTIGCALGMLTVSPVLQARGLGRLVIEGAEDFARAWKAAKMIITVISARHDLIAWYERRGFRSTGVSKAFPYGDQRFGVPRREDLDFVVLEKSL